MRRKERLRDGKTVSKTSSGTEPSQSNQAITPYVRPQTYDWLDGSDSDSDTPDTGGVPLD